MLEVPITVALGLQIILSAIATPATSWHRGVPVHATEISLRGLNVPGRTSNAGKGYDYASNCEEMFRVSMSPSIKQRKNVTSRGKPNRGRVVMMFNSSGHRRRLLIESSFGAEKTRRHQLRCRFVRQDNLCRFAKGRAIARSICALNRFECATAPTYRFSPSAWRVQGTPVLLQTRLIRRICKHYTSSQSTTVPDGHTPVDA